MSFRQHSVPASTSLQYPLQHGPPEHSHQSRFDTHFNTRFNALSTLLHHCFRSFLHLHPTTARPPALCVLRHPFNLSKSPSAFAQQQPRSTHLFNVDSASLRHSFDVSSDPFNILSTSCSTPFITSERAFNTFQTFQRVLSTPFQPPSTTFQRPFKSLSLFFNIFSASSQHLTDSTPRSLILLSETRTPEIKTDADKDEKFADPEIIDADRHSSQNADVGNTSQISRQSAQVILDSVDFELFSHRTLTLIVCSGTRIIHHESVRPIFCH